ncbi:MAG: PDZ domain-containing protein [Balneolaceae bacterium]|jgi:predicted metalloprotease with PDZ domain
MKKLVLILFAGLVMVGCQSKSEDLPSIRYDVRFPNAVHNEAEITLTLEHLLPGPETISMSRSSPGRYALHEFAKNVYNVSAVNSNGDTLEVYRPDLHNWTVRGHDGTIKFKYTLYANHADGTYSGVNEQHAHLNIPATFAWVRSLPDTPITVQFHPPKGSAWKVATQLKPTNDPYTFTAPDYYYFMDSPTELSNFMTTEWDAPRDTTGKVIRLTVHHNGSRQDFERFSDMAKKVVAEEVAVYGEPSNYDFGTYTFIADYLPYVYGDGMEHRNSTILTSKRSLEGENALRNLYTLAHEFFHNWNVERIRPKTIEPFNFMKANMSGALWFAEGFTSYYDDLIIRRTGLISDQKYANDWAGTLNYVLNSPGSSFYNPIEMSMQAPFVDAATSVDEQNKSNTFISYYSWGSVIGLGLDLTLRSNFDDITLDDYMRAMWTKYGKTEKPYTLSELQQTLAEVTKDKEFADQFFADYIYKGRMINLKPLLAKAGFMLQKAHPGEAVLSFGSQKINYESGKATITSNTQIGSPLYNAGIDVNDVILSLDGQSINNARQVQRILAAHKPGDVLTVTYNSLGQDYNGEMTLAQNPEWEVLTYEQVGKDLTDEMKVFRQKWLGSKAQM